jgi:hypothetical protein
LTKQARCCLQSVVYGAAKVSMLLTVVGEF